MGGDKEHGGHRPRWAQVSRLVLRVYRMCERESVCVCVCVCVCIWVNVNIIVSMCVVCVHK